MRSLASNHFFEKHSDTFFAVLGLTVIQWLVFGLTLNKIGIYLDEWISFGKLHFASQKLFDLISSFLADPRVIVRPLEAFHYPVIYYLVHERPLLYHVVNLAFELVAGIFLFLFVKKLLLDSRMAFAIASLYLLWPSHDATHYSIVASSVNVAAMLFIWSLYVSAVALQQSKISLHVWAAILFLTSLLQYEFALPLALIYPLIWLHQRINQSPSSKFLNNLVFSMAPYVVAGLAFVLFRAKVLPALQVGWNYRTTVDGRHFTEIIGIGLGQNFSPATWQFFTRLALDTAKATNGETIVIVLVLIVVTALTFRRINPVDIPVKDLIFTALLGLLIVPLSYVIYGFSPDHTPQLQNGLNRVNMGSSIGMALLLPATLGLLLKQCRKLATGKLFVVVNLLTLTFLALTCMQYAIPWVVSWHTQKQVQSLLRANKQKLLQADSLLLLDVTRFIRWAPVYDGTWDFQNTCRIVLNRPDFNATVLTERLRLKDDALQDQVNGLVLTTMPCKKLLIFQAATGRWTAVNSVIEFKRFLTANNIEIATR